MRTWLVVASISIANVCSIRVDSMNEREADEPDALDKCKQIFIDKGVVSTFAELFSPVLNGLYLFTSTDGKFLSIVDNVNQFVTRNATELCANNPEELRCEDERKRNIRVGRRFRLQRLPRSSLSTDSAAFTIQDTKTKSYLVARNGVLTLEKRKVIHFTHGSDIRKDPSAQWRIRLMIGEGTVMIENVESSIFVSEGDSRNVAEKYVGLAPQGPSTVWKMHVAGRQGRRSRYFEIRNQWKFVSDLPIFRDHKSRLTWRHLCTGEREQSQCFRFYRFERDRMRALGRTDENKRNVVTENKVKSLCDWKPFSISLMINNPIIQREVFASAEGQECGLRRLTEFAAVARANFEEVCYNSCQAKLTELMDGIACSGANMTAVFEKAINENEQCGHMPPDSLEDVGEYVMQRKCHKFYRPSLLSAPNDKDNTDLAADDYDSACFIDDFRKASARTPFEISRQGWCPEGSICNCPILSVRDRPTTAQIRDANETGGEFVGRGAANLPSFLSNYANEFLTEVAKEFVKTAIHAGAIIGAAHTLAAIFAGPAFVFAVALRVVMDIFKKIAEFRCTDSVGCWPAPYSRVKGGACRFDALAQIGGSPLWFLPPPNLQLKRTRFGCKLEACTRELRQTQTVGYGGKKNRNVYNCQPLNFLDMSQENKAAFVEDLSKSVSMEELARARKEHSLDVPGSNPGLA